MFTIRKEIKNYQPLNGMYFYHKDYNPIHRGHHHVYKIMHLDGDLYEISWFQPSGKKEHSTYDEDTIIKMVREETWVKVNDKSVKDLYDVHDT